MKHDNSGSVKPVPGAGGGGGRWDDKYGPPLRVPADALNGERKEDRPCLTPIDCVMDKRCAGHCGCA